MMRNHRKK